MCQLSHKIRGNDKSVRLFFMSKVCTSSLAVSNNCTVSELDGYSSSTIFTDLQKSLHRLQHICGDGDRDRDVDRDQDLDRDLLYLGVQHPDLYRRGGDRDMEQEGDDEHELLSERLRWSLQDRHIVATKGKSSG